MTSFACNYKNNIPNTDFNDLYLDNTGNIATVENAADTEQTINNSIWLWQNEYDYDTTIGTDYDGKVFTNNANLSVVEYYMRNAILLINNYLLPNQVANMGIRSIAEYVANPDPQTGATNVSAIVLLNSAGTITLGEQNAN